MKKIKISILLLICALSIPLYAQEADYSGTIVFGDDPGFWDSYGTHITSNADWLVVGAPREDIDFDHDGVDPAQGDVNAGAVYIYARTGSGPVLHSKLLGDSASPFLGSRFGAGVELQGNTLMIGASNGKDFGGQVDPTPDPDFGDFFFAGVVSVFNYDADSDSWIQVQTLISDLPASGGSFGARTDSSHMALASFGNGSDEPTIALIGEQHPNFNPVPGLLHVFKRKRNSDQWERIQVIDAPAGTDSNGFADSVVVAGHMALVTERVPDPSDPDLTTDRVHVYRLSPNGVIPIKGKLEPIQTLDRPGGLNDTNDCFAQFGDGISASNGIAVIGDACDDSVANNAGAVHVYSVSNSNKSPLQLTQSIPNPSGLSDTFFGASTNFGGRSTLTTDGDLIVVGTPNFFAGLAMQEDVRMFARGEDGDFVLTDSIESPEPAIPGNEGFGLAVDLIGDGELAIGQQSDGATFRGRVMLFDIVD